MSRLREEVSNISYRQNIIDKIDKQIEKGINKYGQVLEDNNLTMDEKLDHHQEELIDALFYTEHLRKDNIIHLSNKDSQIIGEALRLYSAMVAQDVGIDLSGLINKIEREI